MPYFNRYINKNPKTSLEFFEGLLFQSFWIFTVTCSCSIQNCPYRSFVFRSQFGETSGINCKQGFFVTKRCTLEFVPKRFLTDTNTCVEHWFIHKSAKVWRVLQKKQSSRFSEGKSVGDNFERR